MLCNLMFNERAREALKRDTHTHTHFNICFIKFNKVNSIISLKARSTRNIVQLAAVYYKVATIYFVIIKKKRKKNFLKNCT